MSDALPPGWAKEKLGEIVEVRDFEREPINSSERSRRIEGKPQAELFPYYGATGQVGWIDDYRSEGEQVLLGEDGAPFLDQHRDKAYMVNGRYWVNNHAHVLRGLEGALSNRFLVHQLNLTDYHDFVTGSTRLKLTSAAMKKIPLLVPPYAEQVRIVEKLEELLSDLDAGVAELKAAQRKLAKYRQSLLKAAVDGALTADWRAAHGAPEETGAELLQRILTERRARWEQKQLARFAEQGKTPLKGWQAKYPEPTAADLTDLPPLPEGWVWASVEQLSIAQKYGSSAKTNEDSSGVPVLRMGNIQDGEIDCESLKYLPVDHSEFPELLLEDGDLLFNRTNSPELVGKTAVYRSQMSPCSYASYLIAVKLSPWCVPELVAAFINSAYGRRWVKSVATQQVGQANVNGTKLAALAVPLAPFVEQAKIAAVLSSQRQESAQQREAILRGLKQASAQRKNILKAAFAGQLVPQDPHEEPARKLLVRIRAEGAENAKQPKPRKATKPKKEIAAMVTQLIDVLTEAGDWVSAQEAFRRCGVADGALTDRIEELYAELRELDKAGILAVETVTDAQGRKLHDNLKLLVD
ncbi:restriction endonuclease subunit S [Luteimonas composti]|uniref:Restriction endonuclease subunit S n=1 Tax=Luteimonas composti TaxID=398257 RepID=A0ABT6MN50_9GAMM|nr:restriction endonuclease subunit S [Luteimonas composti]MDH7451839.1 restriction endonuclease subunit S [Luteimonas composti]